MHWSETAIIIIAVVAVSLWIAISSAQRLDRLHRKVVSSRLALDAQLLRRAHAAEELASSGVLDPASSVVLADAAKAVNASNDDGDTELVVAMPDLSELVIAHRLNSGNNTVSKIAVMQALDGTLGGDREVSESALTAVVESILDDADFTQELYSCPETEAYLNALSHAWYRVQLARRFHNESVLQAQRVRSHPLVRFFRIAGRAPMPQTVEFDDAWPTGLRLVTVRSH
ncbi:hypothetical protein [Timonella sp. A28]|uniref:hypothetical protein n=1 Tax=Timonella sp. A28 TaxID=3442640 RepID=UPI003EBCB8E5